jgi:hypothetical protein
MPDDSKGPIAWYQSAQIRVALSLIVPLLLKLLISTGLPEKLGIDLSTVNADRVVDWIIAIALPFAAAFWIKKRVDAGNPKKPDPAKIVEPPTARMIRRLTR